MNKYKFSLLLGIFLISTLRMWSQDVYAQVEIMHNRITNVDKSVFDKLKSNITEFVNNRKWTSDVFNVQERIQCNFLINILEVIGDPAENTYKASITIQSTRPVYNSTYTTQMVNYLDKELVFRYEPGQNLIFDENRVAGADPLVANLPAVLAFYINIILGFDYDSFAPMGGENYFKKAQHIVLNAPEDSRGISGWQSQDPQRNNRYWIADNILNQRYRDIRMFWYDYHMMGLDKMSSDPKNSCLVIYSHFEKLKKVFKENSTSIFMSLIFTAKAPELINLLSAFDNSYKQDAIKILVELDPVNAGKYRNVK